MLKILTDFLNMLLMRKRLVIQEHQRALLFQDGRIIDLLQPGEHYLWNLWHQFSYAVFDLSVIELNASNAAYLNILLKEHPKLVAQHFFVADVPDQQVALLTMDGKMQTVLPPNTRQLYWQAFHDFTLEFVNLHETYEIPRDQLMALARLKNAHVMTQIVPEASVGVLFVDGQLAKTLAPGAYGFWKPGREIRCDLIDLRLQQVDVAGQELLTKDRINLRMTLTCWYVITDPVKVKTRVANYADHLYKEIQFSLRDAVGAKTLDELLDDKDSLNTVILRDVQPKLAEVGVEVRSVGLKDVILPGDMRTIVNKVIEAKKIAEANQIKRREETAATRSLLNTAKLMEDNPTLMRLKELETLEKVAEQIQNLHVYGGFDKLLNDLVTIKKPA